MNRHARFLDVAFFESQTALGVKGLVRGFDVAVVYPLQILEDRPLGFVFEVAVTRVGVRSVLGRGPVLLRRSASRVGLCPVLGLVRFIVLLGLRIFAISRTPAIVPMPVAASPATICLRDKRAIIRLEFYST